MRIGVLAATTGTTAKTIRFYEQAGPMPNPPRTSAGYRDYPPDTPARFAFIRAAQPASLTLADIRGQGPVDTHPEPSSSSRQDEQRSTRDSLR